MFKKASECVPASLGLLICRETGGLEGGKKKLPRKGSPDSRKMLHTGEIMSKPYMKNGLHNEKDDYFSCTGGRS